MVERNESASEGTGDLSSALTYKCPKTSRVVKTAIVTQPAILARMRGAKISVACPDCIEGHRIPANEMYLDPWVAVLNTIQFDESGLA